MKFFENVRTLDELRKEYRRLAMIYHPDKGGDTLTMQMLNAQYERLSKTLINNNAEFSESRKEYEMQVSEGKLHAGTDCGRFPVRQDKEIERRAADRIPTAAGHDG